MYQFLVIVDGERHYLVINNFNKLCYYIEEFFGTTENIEVYGKEYF